MKRNKGLNVTKGDIISNVDTERKYCSNFVSGNARTHLRHATIGQHHYSFKDFEYQNVSNWSHVACTCDHSDDNSQDTKLKQMKQKGFMDIGVGNVKPIHRRKVKKVYLPETEDRAVETLDLCGDPKCQHLCRYNEYNRKASRKLQERPNDRHKKLLLDKKLSPLVKKKSNYTNPLSNLYRIHEMDKYVRNTSLNNRFNVTTQVYAKELAKSQKIKIFKESAINTEIINPEKEHKSDIELSAEMSKLLNNKNCNDLGSSLDSLVQHIYNLDKPCDATVSQISIDPMENKLEREYRKIFSCQSQDNTCDNTVSTTNSDSLLHRFEALRRDVSSKDESKINMPKTSTQLNEPSCKEFSVDSDIPSIRTTTNSNNIKLQRSSYLRRSDVDESDHQKLKTMFKLWGKKLSLDDESYKKSKQKRSNINKKSEASMTWIGKLAKTKSSFKKEGKKFCFFKKKVSPSKVSKSKKDFMTGRCEVREGLNIQIGKSFSKQGYNTKTIKKVGDDLLLKTWIKHIVSKSTTGKKSSRWDGSKNSSCSGVSDLGTSSSYGTDILLFPHRLSPHYPSCCKLNGSPMINFSKQYVQAWMLTKIILDRLVQPKIYKNVKTDKYNRRKNSIVGYVNSKKAFSPVTKALPIYTMNVKEDFKQSSESVMVDISLGCMSDFNQKVCVHNLSNEKVYKITNYETPLSSSLNFLNSNMINGTFPCDVVNNKRKKEITNCKKKDKQVFKKNERSYKTDTLQDIYRGAPNACNAVGVGIVTQNDVRELNYPIYELESAESDDNLEDSLYVLPKNCPSKFYHNWNPLLFDLDLWGISDTDLQLPFNINNNDANFRMPINDTKYTTLISSYDTSTNVRHTKSVKTICAKDVKYRKILQKKLKSSLYQTDIRISPKDSLEVFRKRKLYSNSSKRKWLYDNETDRVSLSASTKSSDFTQMMSSKPTKKHVTIPKYKDDNNQRIEIWQREKPPRKNKNLQNLTSSHHISDFNNINGKIAEAKFKLAKENSIVNNVSVLSIKSVLSQDTAIQTVPPLTDNTHKCLKCSSKNNLLKNTESILKCYKKKANGGNLIDNITESSQNIKVTSPKSEYISEYFKSSKNIKKYYNIYRKLMKLESDKKSSNVSLKNSKEKMKCSITTDVQNISSLPEKLVTLENTFVLPPINDLEINRGKAKLLGLHFKKQPIKRNLSKACWTTDDKSDSSVSGLGEDSSRIQSKESIEVIMCKDYSAADRDSSSYTINNECVHKNINVPSLSDTKKVTQLREVSTSGSVKNVCNDSNKNKEYSNDIESECDLVEILFKIKCKRGDDRAMLVNINNCHEGDKKEKRNKVSRKESDIDIKNKEVFIVQNEFDPVILPSDSKNNINVKILIKSCKNEERNKKEHSEEKSTINSKSICENLPNNSSGFSKAVDDNLYSVHKLTIDLTNSVKSNDDSNTVLGSKNKETFISDKDIDENLNTKGINIYDTSKKSGTKSCILNDDKDSLDTKVDNTEIKNQKRYFSSATIRPDKNHSFNYKTVSNHKEQKYKVIQKIVECAKDLNKSKRKEKLLKRLLRETLSTDSLDKTEGKQDVDKYSDELTFPNLYSKFLSEANNSDDYCHCDSTTCVKASDINTDSYLFTVTKTNKQRPNPPFANTKWEKTQKCFPTTLATKLGLTDLRTNVHQSMSSDFIHNLKSNDIKNLSELNYLLGQNYADPIMIQKVKEKTNQDIIMKNDIELNSKEIMFNNDSISGDEKKIPIVSGNYLEEKLFNDHTSGVKDTCNKCAQATIDILELSEIKKAVFEMYKKADMSNNSEILVTLPKFESDVENLLIM